MVCCMYDQHAKGLSPCRAVAAAGWPRPRRPDHNNLPGGLSWLPISIARRFRRARPAILPRLRFPPASLNFDLPVLRDMCASVPGMTLDHVYIVLVAIDEVGGSPRARRSRRLDRRRALADPDHRRDDRVWLHPLCSWLCLRCEHSRRAGLLTATPQSQQSPFIEQTHPSPIGRGAGMRSPVLRSDRGDGICEVFS